MELSDTVQLMVSANYKDRLKAEYYQLSIRTEKLGAYLKSNYSELLSAQLALMQAYRNILKERVALEGIQVDEI